jgi:hypothetical protein
MAGPDPAASGQTRTSGGVVLLALGPAAAAAAAPASGEAGSLMEPVGLKRLGEVAEGVAEGETE